MAMIQSMNKIYYLYKHIFPNNKVYIGITCQKPKERWRNGLGYRSQSLMWKAIQKYGWENIQHEILYTTIDKNIIEQKEREYITEIYHSNNADLGYNVELGGNYSGKRSKEISEKISIKLKGQKRTQEQKERISRAHRGISVSQQTKEKLSIIMSEKYVGKNNPMYGKKLSEEHKQKLLIAIKNTRKRKPIRCIETNEIFESLQAAANAIGLYREGSGRLWFALQKPNRTCKGYHWEYIENNDSVNESI